MALETLIDVKHIGGFDLVIMDDLRAKFPDKFTESGSMDYNWFEKDIRPKNFIYVRIDKNSIAFTIQNGPIKENGVNGCQIDQIVQAAEIILSKLNEKFECTENIMALHHLRKSLDYLADRKKNREQRGVEGENKA